jgi:hypothetical protein
VLVNKLNFLGVKNIRQEIVIDDKVAAVLAVVDADDERLHLAARKSHLAV